MFSDYYTEIDVSNDYEVFDFQSTGIRGIIKKRAIFSRLKLKFLSDSKIYNLAFGDVLENGEIDVLSISDNNDMEKLLSTIWWIIKIFLAKYTDRKVFIRGSTRHRNRLYRMVIGNNLDAFSEMHSISAILTNDEIVKFEKDIFCIAFMIEKKS